MFWDKWTRPTAKHSTGRWVEYFLVFAAIVTAIALSLMDVL